MRWNDSTRTLLRFVGQGFLALLEESELVKKAVFFLVLLALSSFLEEREAKTIFRRRRR